MKHSAQLLDRRKPAAGNQGVRRTKSFSNGREFICLGGGSSASCDAVKVQRCKEEEDGPLKLQQ